MLQVAQMGFPEMYERALVVPLFQPWAEHLVSQVGIAPGESVLDVACGTGIVARIARERVGPAGRVVGIDVNAAMLAVARSVAPDVDWREGDAGSLPVGDSERFDVVVCQQGLQFFPDRVTALSEMRRVLVPGGRIGLSTWRSDEESTVLRELRRVAERHVGQIVDRRHGYHDPHDLEKLMMDAGFDDVKVERVSQIMRFDDGAAFVHLNAMALIGMSSRAKDLGEADRAQTLAAIVSGSRAILARNTDASGFSYAITANVATALGGERHPPPLPRSDRRG
jgi:ubiquinone/menaquinone biosynthesis C-methylase UbiE